MARVESGGVTYVTRSVLRDRGWSTKMVTQLLGDPDRWARDPQWGSLAALYDLDRVVAVETSPAFREALRGRLSAKGRSVVDQLAQLSVRDREGIARWMSIVSG